jgi:hypothetical protein
MPVTFKALTGLQSKPPFHYQKPLSRPVFLVTFAHLFSLLTDVLCTFIVVVPYQKLTAAWQTSWLNFSNIKVAI